MTTTTPRALAVAAIFGALAGWLVVVYLLTHFDLVPPYVPWTAPAALVVSAALVGALAWSTHQRIQVRKERVEPERAVAFLVLGKASALAGAVIAGGYLAFALMFVGRWDAAGPRERVIRALVAVVVAVGPVGRGSVAGAGLPGARRDDDDDARRRRAGRNLSRCRAVACARQ